MTCRFHGGPVSECGDDEVDWFPQRSICWPTAQLEAAKGLYSTLHQERPFHDGSFTNWVKERTHAYPFHYSDGVSFYMSRTDENPDDAFLTTSVFASDEVDGNEGN